MTKRKQYFSPEIDLTTLLKDFAETDVLISSTGFEADDYDLEGGNWW